MLFDPHVFLLWCLLNVHALTDRATEGHSKFKVIYVPYNGQ
jgi:hypothetical protein